MNNIVANIRKNISTAIISRPDWLLLLFLVLFLNVKLVVKAVAIVIIYLFRPDFRLGFRFRLSRLPLFYPIVILITIANYLLFAGFNHPNYSFTWLNGLLFWTACILAIHQVKLAVERSGSDRIHATLQIFFLFNIAVSGIQLLRIIIETGALNPYRYQGLYQKYFISTGDYIRGITLDTSTTNAALNAIGLLYFLKRGQLALSILCMVCLLFTCSNFINLLLMGILGYCFLFNSTRNEKSVIIVCLCCLVLFLARVSPQNNEYSIKTFQHFFHQKITGRSILTGRDGLAKESSVNAFTEEEKKHAIAKAYIDSLSYVASLKNATTGSDIKARPVIPEANIHSAPYQHRPDSSALRFQVIQLALKLGKDTSHTTSKGETAGSPGKIVALQQTVQFLRQHPSKLLTGDGTGNFSSKLAFRATGLKVAGGYPGSMYYINPDFAHNHLGIFLDYFGKDSGYHSITNTPNSVYAQMLGEYGLAGLAALLCCYLGWFSKGARRLVYGFPILVLLAGIFLVDYWYEQLSVVVLSELILFLNKKETNIDWHE